MVEDTDFPDLARRRTIAHATTKAITALLKLAPEQRPQTKQTLEAFALRFCRDGAKLYAFDPRDAVKDAAARGIVDPEVSEDVRFLLADATPPSEVSAAIPQEKWPSEAADAGGLGRRFAWRRRHPPENAQAATLAKWFNDSAYLHMPLCAQDVVLELTNGPNAVCSVRVYDALEYKPWVDARGGDRLKPSNGDGLVWIQPWLPNLQKKLKGMMLDDEAALLLDIVADWGAWGPQSTLIQKIRDSCGNQKLDNRPHIKLIYPFLAAEHFSIKSIQRGLDKAGAQAFDLSFDDVVSAGDDGRLFMFALRPDEKGLTDLQSLRSILLSVLPRPPCSTWPMGGFFDEANKNRMAKGKGKGKNNVDAGADDAENVSKPCMQVAASNGYQSDAALQKMKKQLPPAGIKFRVSKISLSQKKEGGEFREVAALQLVDTQAPATGVGATICGIDGEVWGMVVADGGKIWKLESGRMAKKETEGARWKWASEAASAETLTGVGGTIRGIGGGEVWGVVEADGGKVWKLVGGRIAKKETEGAKWEWSK